MIQSCTTHLCAMFNRLGEYGPVLMIGISVYLLRAKDTSVFYYLVGAGVNVIVNIILKLVFRQPRPNVSEKQMHMLNNWTHWISGISPLRLLNLYGMPSGHAQTAWFSTAYMSLATRNIRIAGLYILLSIITCIQRVAFGWHTTYQVFVGSLIGVALGTVMYSLVRESRTIRQSTNRRRDDDGQYILGGGI